MGSNKWALDYYHKALRISEELNDRVGMARDYTNIEAVLSNMGNYQEALVYHNKALNIFLDLEKTTDSPHPLIEILRQRIEELHGRGTLDNFMVRIILLIDHADNVVYVI